MGECAQIHRKKILGYDSIGKFRTKNMRKCWEARRILQKRKD